MDEPKKRVFFVITKSNWGGAQRYVYDLATTLPKDAFEVAVALGGSGRLRERLHTAGIPVIQLSNVQRDLSVSADTAGFGEVYAAIKKFRPDIVHLNSSKAGGLGALAARLQSVPRIIFTAHGWPFEEKRGILWRLMALLGSYATALLAHQVIVISKKDLQLGRRMPFCKQKMHLIYNGIGPITFGSGECIRNAFPPGAPITGTLGELTKNKNQIALIEQAKNDSKLFVAIVGEGEERQRLEERIKKYGLESRVKLFGFMSPEEVMKGFDAFALQSLKEGLPYVLLEAKAAGLPITANRVGGIPDILDETHDFSLARMSKETADLYH